MNTASSGEVPAHRAPRWARALAYDLGRSVRLVGDGSEMMAAGGAALLWRARRGLSGLRRRGRPGDRGEVFDPRAQLQGQYLAQALAEPRGRAQLVLVSQTSPYRGPRELHRGRELELRMTGLFDAVGTGGRVELEALYMPMAQALPLEARDLKALADISGFSKALEQVIELALRHDRDPSLHALADRLEALPFAERRAWAARLLERIAGDRRVMPLIELADLRQADATLGGIELGSVEILALMEAITEGMATALLELGLSHQEIAAIAEVIQITFSPLDELARFYLQPRGLGERVRRGWRLQRMLWVAIRAAGRRPDLLRV
ncbi:MAG: hypothetical protein OEZ06_18065 [Myxococcales bacterium]|nr:hypothetical protein [Myxococcales bacterium]